MAGWHFDGGEKCRSCPEPCADCPYTQNHPQSLAGIEAWLLVSGCSSSVRRSDSGTIIGIDYQTLLALARARGIDDLVAEFLPAIEVGAILGRKVFETDEAPKRHYADPGGITGDLPWLI